MCFERERDGIKVTIVAKNDSPEFVAEREERRQMGIDAKNMRMLPVFVHFGRRGDNRQRFNNDRQNRRC